MINRFADAIDGSWIEKKKFNAEIIETTIEGEKVLLVKPSTFYNDTGLSARQLLDFYSLNPAEDFLVIHDDLALPIGTVRTRKQGSDAGNNGIKSLNQHIGEHYSRIRVGIWTELRDHMDDVAFVLGNFTKEEKDVLLQAYPHVASFIKEFVDGSLSHGTAKVELAPTPPLGV